MMTKNSRWTWKLPAAALSAAAAWAAAPAAHAGWPLNMTPGISEMSRHIYDLHMLMFWWCVWIAIFVFGFMIYSMVKFRKSAGAVDECDLLIQRHLGNHHVGTLIR